MVTNPESRNQSLSPFAFPQSPLQCQSSCWPESGRDAHLATAHNSFPTFSPAVYQEWEAHGHPLGLC